MISPKVFYPDYGDDIQSATGARRGALERRWISDIKIVRGDLPGEIVIAEKIFSDAPRAPLLRRFGQRQQQQQRQQRQGLLCRSCPFRSADVH